MKESAPIPPSRVLGVFGMSIFTRRDDLEKVFGEYGPIEKVELIYNRQVSLKSRKLKYKHNSIILFFA